MIYFLQPLQGGPVKIGYSEDVDARRRQLESHYGCPLAILCTMQGGRAEETAIHDRFTHLRFGRTEQFRPARDLMEFIGRPLLIDPNPAVVEIMTRSIRPVVFRCTEAYAEWLEGVAKHYRTTVAGVIDRAMAEWTAANGYPEAPPERTP